MYQSVTTNGLLQRLFCSLELPSILLLAITLQLWCCTSRISTRILSAQKTYFSFSRLWPILIRGSICLNLSRREWSSSLNSSGRKTETTAFELKKIWLCLTSCRKKFSFVSFMTSCTAISSATLTNSYALELITIPLLKSWPRNVTYKRWASSPKVTSTLSNFKDIPSTVIETLNIPTLFLHWCKLLSHASLKSFVFKKQEIIFNELDLSQSWRSWWAILCTRR